MATDTSCAHDKLTLGFDELNEPPRQCPDCWAWFQVEYEVEYEESFDGEDETCWFSLIEVPAPVE